MALDTYGERGGVRRKPQPANIEDAELVATDRDALEHVGLRSRCIAARKLQQGEWDYDAVPAFAECTVGGLRVGAEDVRLSPVSKGK